MSRLTIEDLIRKLDKLSEDFRHAVESTRGDESLDTDTWGTLEHLANELDTLCRDVRSDLR